MFRGIIYIFEGIYGGMEIGMNKKVNYFREYK